MRTKPTITQQGLGWAHQKRRKVLLALHYEGKPCGECGEPMYKSQGLDADHSIERCRGGLFADRLLHASCNRGRHGRTRRAVRGKGQRMDRPVTSRQW